MNSLLRNKNRWYSVVTGFLVVYGLCHALVDASCAFLVLGMLDLRSDFWIQVFAYNALAFGLQLPFGYLADRFIFPRIYVIIGLFCILMAFEFFMYPILAVCIVGIGNALFHIGGGQIALNIDKQKAVYPGVFVAPGGVGLAIGIYLSHAHLGTNLNLFPVLLIIMIGLLVITKVPVFTNPKTSKKEINLILVIVLFLMLSISIRSLIGLEIVFPWKSNLYLLILLTVAISFGKVVGGILADRFGWIKTGVSGLILAAPMLAFGSTHPLLGLFGIFMFNFTMPITLVAISTILPGRAGLAFGLTTLALFIGAVPTYIGSIGWLAQGWIVFVFILFSAIFLYFGLKTLNSKKSQSI